MKTWFARIICMLFLFVIPAMRAFSQLSTYTRTYTVQDGLAQNSVNGILKGDEGLIWLISKDGLSLFDGYEFRNFKASSEILKRSVSNQFLSLKKDGCGCLWILNDIGQVLRFNPKNEQFELFPSAEENRGLFYFSTSSWTQISPNELWLLGANATGAIRLTMDENCNVLLKRFCEETTSHSGCNVRSVVPDHSGRRWILTDRGVWFLNAQDSVLNEYNIHTARNNSVYSMIETPNELIFSCANGQYHKYDKTHRRFENSCLDTEEDLVEVRLLDDSKCQFVARNGVVFTVSLLDNKVLKKQMEESAENDEEIVFKDTMGVSWMTSQSPGVRKVVSFNESFRLTLCDAEKKCRASDDISAMMEDRERKLWVASKDGSLRIYDNDGQLLGYLNSKGLVQKDFVKFESVSAMTQDHNGTIWLATLHAVVSLKKNSETSYALRFCRPESPQFAPITYQISDILEDSKGHIWLATRGGGLHLMLETENGFRFIHKENLFKDNFPPTVEQSHSLMEDHQGNIWLGSSEGLTLFSSDFEQPEMVRFLFYNTENTNLTNSCIYDIYQDQKDNIWLASYGGGLFKLDGDFVFFQTPNFVSYNRQNSLFPTDLLLDVTEDAYGNLWVLTEESIVRFSPSSNMVESFGQFRGFYSDIFAGRMFVRKYSGELVAATNSGFYTFSPSDISATEYCPDVVFTRFLLFNKEQNIHGEDALFKNSIYNLQEVTLEHNQSVFSVGFSALDYRFPERIQYAYKLEPFETEWNYVGSQRLATYTNLPQGEYRFMVKSTNSEGIWSDNVKELKIVVKPSFWQTGWAYCLYVLLIAIVVGVFIYLYNLRTKIKMEQEVSDSKLHFFTDISHELRTPLTLISAPLENVLENGSLQEEDRAQLEVVRTNANRMLRMMNQILDFRKMQSNKMRLKVQKTKLGAFVASCSSNFLRLAEDRHINFTIKDHTEGATFWIDRDKVDTLMFNLLSNAFKFTGEGKSISVDIRVENGDCVVSVADEGCGMPKDKLSVIFDRYTTLQNYSLTKQSGTGIGLSLVKEIVELHHASINVESEEGKGSLFSITFLHGNEHFDERAELFAEEDVKENEEESSMPVVDQQTILIVEDNDQMREFLKNVLKKRFVVLEAPNGKVGYEMAIKEVPSFILTDVMMPEMDGIEMTRNLRSEERTSHIPIILLTAKTDVQSKIECMKIGANDYITKPFSMDYLEARINNILEERVNWQKKYREELLKSSKFAISETEETLQEKVSPMRSADDEMMRKFVNIIEANLSNVDFSVEDAQDALKVSRWHLLSKVKSLVGLTPNEFIKETRLAHAAKLIDEGELNMTQIAYTIGMTDSRYFSRCFKQKYGVTPTEYKNRK